MLLGNFQMKKLRKEKAFKAPWNEWKLEQTFFTFFSSFWLESRRLNFQFFKFIKSSIFFWVQIDFDFPPQQLAPSCFLSLFTTPFGVSKIKDIKIGSRSRFKWLKSENLRSKAINMKSNFSTFSMPLPIILVHHVAFRSTQLRFLHVKHASHCELFVHHISSSSSLFLTKTSDPSSMSFIEHTQSRCWVFRKPRADLTCENFSFSIPQNSVIVVMGCCWVKSEWVGGWMRKWQSCLQLCSFAFHFPFLLFPMINDIESSFDSLEVSKVVWYASVFLYFTLTWLNDFKRVLSELLHTIWELAIIDGKYLKVPHEKVF